MRPGKDATLEKAKQRLGLDHTPHREKGAKDEILGPDHLQSERGAKYKFYYVAIII